MIRNVKHLLHRGGSTTADDQIIVDALNHGHRELHSVALFPAYRKWGSFSIVQYQQNYDLPTDYIGTDLLTYKNNLGTAIPQVTQTEMMIAYTEPYNRNSERPRFYTTIYAKSGTNAATHQIQLFPRPSTAATAGALSGAHNASVTTLDLADSSSFPAKGRVIVNSEVMEYNHNDTANNQLEGVTRAVEGTTAASHSNTDVVTLRDMNLYYWATADDLTADTQSPLYPETYHMTPVYYAVWFVLSSDGNNPELAAQMLQKFEQGKLEARKDMSMRRRDGISRIREYYHDPKWMV
jgi:hypothetical protein